MKKYRISFEYRSYNDGVDEEGIYPINDGIDTDRLSPVIGPDLFCHDILEHFTSLDISDGVFEGLTEELMAFAIVFGVRIYAKNIYSNYRYDDVYSLCYEWYELLIEDLRCNDYYIDNILNMDIIFPKNFEDYMDDSGYDDMPELYVKFPQGLMGYRHEIIRLITEDILDTDYLEEVIENVDKWFSNRENIAYMSKIMAYSYWIFHVKYGLCPYKWASIWEQLNKWYREKFIQFEDDIIQLNLTLHVDVDWTNYSLDISLIDSDGYVYSDYKIESWR